MSDKEYFAHPFLNASTLKAFSGPEDRYSQRQALYKMQTPFNPTPAMQLGTLFHAGMEDGFVKAKPALYTEFRSDKAKAWRADMEERGEPIYSQKDIDTAKAMIESVKIMAPDVWDKARSSLAVREREVYNGARKLKCKEDLFIEGTVWDWKSAKGITPYDIRRSCDFFGYDLQAFHYLSADIEAKDFNFLFVQTEAPFEVVIVPAKPIMERGRKKWETAFRRYKDRTNEVLQAKTINPLWQGGKVTEVEL